mmetsp:Transcript_18230/g.27050  ORF Transcript_18230/g.27050 Transcript_18230/m.27050 type:complete len:812 (-) Transcript_18230:63-2498(-)
MFFRRKQKPAGPIVGDDGFYYAAEGQEYDSDEFETDSDYSDGDVPDDEKDAAEEQEHDINVDEGKELVDASDSGNKEEPVGSNGSSATFVMVENDAAKDDANKGAKELEASTAKEQQDVEEIEILTFDKNDAPLELELELESDSEDLIDSNARHSIESSGLETVNLEEDNVKENAKDAQQLTSLYNKRSMLALAAKHDRVDIIKTILQPNTNSDNKALAQLLLNNINIDGNSQYTKDDLEPIFLPPLHIAIASSSTNAASCLLRMGSNPAIRPEIPNDWKGPDWGETVVDGNKWNVFHNMSAWEIAYGTTRKSAPGTEGKKGWLFGFKSSSNLVDEVPKLYIPIKIDAAKLEGIKHAFTAEALRAIGSDEVERLGELLDSGLGSTTRIEIGGKDLFGWCHEMSAATCIKMLEKRYSATESKSEEAVEVKGIKDDDNDVAKENNEGEVDDNLKDDDDDSCIYDELALLDLRNKLEESESLAIALSSMLDNLAEEVSVTQGLLMEHGDDTNAALLSQVRLLKKQREEVEDEIIHCEACLSDRYAELDMCTMWWIKQGGSLDNIPIRPVPAAKAAKADPFETQPVDFKARGKEISKQLCQSETKVKKLRASIADLSQESARNLEKVEKLGLLGAVKLIRKLKEEVRVQKEALEAVVREESSARARVLVLKEMLERGEASKNQKAPSEAVQPSSVEIDRDIIEEVRPESPILQEFTGPNQSNSDSYESYESEDSDSDYSSGESESDSDSYESDEDYERGHSTAIIKWVDDGDLGVFTFKVWNLLVRMFGLSRNAIKQTAQATVDDVVNLPRVMII